MTACIINEALEAVRMKILRLLRLEGAGRALQTKDLNGVQTRNPCIERKCLEYFCVAGFTHIRCLDTNLQRHINPKKRRKE